MVNDNLAVDDHVFHSDGGWMRIDPGRPVGNLIWVEHNQVGAVCRLEPPPLLEPEPRGRNGRHLVDHPLERHKFLFPDVFSERAGKSAIVAGMRLACATDTVGSYRPATPSTP